MNKPSSSPHRPWLRPVILAVLAVALCLAAWQAWKYWGGGSKTDDEYIFATVQRGDVEDLVGATGMLQPRDYVDVGAQVSGQLKKLHVEVGNEVTEGQLLAEIDAEQSAARVDANRASLRAQQATLIERQANLAKAERDLQRQRNLMAEEATTTEQVQNAETALRTAGTQVNSTQAQIEQQQASMRVEEANLKFTKIYSPIAGTVVSITARQGQTLNATQSAPIVMRVADLSTMTVQTQVGEADVSKLSIGMSSYFTTLGSPGRRWYGTVRKIEPTPTVTNNVVLYNALFDVPNPTRTLMSQMTAQVFFVISEARGVLVVPVSALTMQRSGGRGQAERPADAKAGAAVDAAKAPAAGSAAPAANSPAPATSRPAPVAGEEKARGRRSEAGGQPQGRRGEGAGRQGGAAREGAAREAGAGGMAKSAGPGTATGREKPAPRRATVKVQNADGSVSEREVMVGTSSRVSAEILSGLTEGERIVVGVKVPAEPQKGADSKGTSALGAGAAAVKGVPGGGGVGGGGRR